MTRRGLVVDGHTPGAQGLRFVDSVLRGIGQVMLQDNSYTGVLFLIGIFWNSPLFGCGALIGATASTATAVLLGAQREATHTGVFGFNGALVAIALLYFLHPDALAWVYLIMAAATSTVVMLALSRWLDTWQVPALTAPFVITTLLFMLACARFGRLHPTDVLPLAGLPKAAVVEGVVTAATVVQGLFNGVAQVFFQGNVGTGVFFLAGLAVNSRTTCALAIAGSLAGLLVAWGLGASEAAIRGGAFGFNTVLTAIALGSGRLAPGIRSGFFVMLACVATTVVYAAVSAALEPIGMPALTLPFVLVVWVGLFAVAHCRWLPATTPDQATP